MSQFGALQRALADEQQFRWLGPHKGIVQLALASVTNACFDLWAKRRGVPLWKLLTDLSPEAIARMIAESVVLLAEVEGRIVGYTQFGPMDADGL